MSIFLGRVLGIFGGGNLGDNKENQDRGVHLPIGGWRIPEAQPAHQREGPLLYGLRAFRRALPPGGGT